MAEVDAVLAAAKYRKEDISGRIMQRCVCMPEMSLIIKFLTTILHRCPLLLLLKNYVIMAEEVIQLN